MTTRPLHPLAEELNTVLAGSVALRTLSPLGRRMYFPKGIVSQSAEATESAHRFNATVGMAYEAGRPMIMPATQQALPELGPVETVAYSPTAGNPALRTQWLAEIVAKNPDVRPDTVSVPVVVPGLTNGIFQIAELFCDDGDQLVLPDLFWGNYRMIFEERRGAVVTTYPFFTADGTEFAVESFRAGIEQAAAAGGTSKLLVLLNFPHNPTGYSPTKAVAAAMVDILTAQAERGSDIVVICDDAYFGLLYEPDVYTQSLFAPLSRAHSRILAVKIDGATKEEFVWGFRIGFVTFGGRDMSTAQYGALVKKLMGSIRATISNSSTVGQSLILRQLTDQSHEADKGAKFALLARRYARVQALVTAMTPAERALMRPLPFNSGYFMSFECLGCDAEALRVRLLAQGIGTIAIQNRYLRIAYASIDEADLPALYQEIFATAAGL